MHIKWYSYNIALIYEFPIKPVCNLYNFNNEQVIFKVEIPILLLWKFRIFEETANAQNYLHETYQ